jgi:hypothetical protein
MVFVSKFLRTEMDSYRMTGESNKNNDIPIFEKIKISCYDN